MADSKNVQDVFLNHIRKNKISVTIFLVNGVKLTGIVTWFDNFSVLLRRDAHVAAGLQACDFDDHASTAGEPDGRHRSTRRLKQACH